MRRLRKWMALTAEEKWLLLLALVAVAQVRVSLWILPFRWIARRMEQSLPADCRIARYSLERVIWSVRAASRLVPRASCLTQAIAAKQLIEDYGTEEVSLRIGVRKSPEDSLEAHAWLEYQGEVVLGQQEGTFTPMTKF